MNRYEDEMTRSLSRDLRHADKNRRRVFIVLAVIAIAATVVGGGAVAVGMSASRASTETSATEQNTAASGVALPDPSESKPQPEEAAGVQKATIEIGQLGYEPSTVTVKSGADVELTVAKGEGCAAGFLMPELGISADNSGGPATVRLSKLEQGTYRFTCGMEMVEGRLVVE